MKKKIPKTPYFKTNIKKKVNKKNSFLQFLNFCLQCFELRLALIFFIEKKLIKNSLKRNIKIVLSINSSISSLKVLTFNKNQLPLKDYYLFQQYLKYCKNRFRKLKIYFNLFFSS
jgi:hypothetical protein